MSTLTAPYQLFNLESYSHTEIFDTCSHVWEALLQLDAYFNAQKLGRIAVNIPEGVHLVHPEFIQIEEGVVIEPGAYIQGPCILGKDCVVRQGAYIRGHVLVGKRCVIGHGTEVKRSIFLDDVSAAHFNYVGNSILGNKVNLGAGVKCANLKIDRSSVHVWVDGVKIDTQMKKLGAIVGDGAQIGCNCVINPGTILGKQAVCFPCLNLSGFIPSNATVRLAAKNIVEQK